MRKFVLTIALVLMAGGAQAATLNVVGGLLHGASNVLVDGSLYDVQFLDGTCIVLYNGCDDAADFTFQTEASALLASQALLDQVFLDGPLGLFDGNPSLTYSCAPPSFFICLLLTPYQIVGPPNPDDVVLAAAAINADSSNGSNEGIASGNPGRTFDTTPLITRGFAVWAPIPEPSTVLLLGLGLTGLAAKGRRRNRS